MAADRIRAGMLVVALVVTACGGRSRVAAGEASPVSADSAAALEAAFRARRDSARGRFTAADVRFVNGMIGHHAQAVVMARLAPTHGASRAVRTLAARIINAQQDEIALMQQWLRDRRQPVPEFQVTGTTIVVSGAGHAVHAPGMLSDAQLAELDRGRGPEFDRLFLTFMIQHHRGAVAMVHELLATDGAAQDGAIFKFASDIRVDQSTEIARMERMLAALSAGGDVRSP
jgi:uncharacterized protein (DUF305 family)